MIRRVDIPVAVTEDLARALRELPVPSEGLAEQFAALLRLAGRLPSELLSALLALRAGVDAPGTLLVSGVPIDADLPATPSGAICDLTSTGPVSRRALLLLAILLGEPLAYQDEKDGALVQDVYPVPTFETAPSNDGSAIELAFHTELTFSRSAPEQPFHVTCPDFLMLLALRCPADRAATTMTVDAHAICGRLTDDQLAVLRDAQFQLRAPHSFTRDGQSRPWSPPVPLLHGSSAAPAVAFDLACGARALSAEAAAALNALRVVCSDPAVQNKVQLRPGDLLVVDNNRCAHARTPFPAHYDGHDRWLRRVYVRRSIWQLQSSVDPATRVVA